MTRKANHLAAIDLGSSKTRALIAELRDEGPELRQEGDASSQLRFLGFGEVDSWGWNKGMIADLEKVTRCVKEAATLAEKMAGVPLESAVVGVGGPHVGGASTACGLLISSRPRELTRDDARRVMETARDIPLSKDREILHLVPEEFILDSQGGIHDPIGMRGSYLAVKAHIVTGSAAASANVVAAVNRAGILVETTVLEAFAAAEVVLSEEERDLGALVAVLGGGTCDMVIYRQGGLRNAGVVPIGGDHFTNDVAVGVHTSFSNADMIKKTFGSVLAGQCKEGTTIEVPGAGGQPSWFAPQRLLLDILEVRAEELLGFVLDEILNCGLEHQLGAGVILCGGGARLGGMCDLAEHILGGPVRLGLPPAITGMPDSLESTEYATLIGLLLYAQRLWKLRASTQNRAPVSRWKSLLVGTS